MLQTNRFCTLNLTKLEHLDLHFNNFDHSIASSWFWKATSLKYLNLGSNRLFAQIPDAIGNMTSLKSLLVIQLVDDDRKLEESLQFGNPRP